MNEAKPQQARHDQKRRDNVIQELRHDQNEDAGNQRDNWLKVSDAESHVRYPLLDQSARKFDAASWLGRLSKPTPKPRPSSFRMAATCKQSGQDGRYNSNAYGGVVLLRPPAARRLPRQSHRQRQRLPLISTPRLR